MMNDYEFGPKYSPNELVEVINLGWCTIVSTKWEDTEWIYVVEADDKETYEVKEWEIIF